MGGPRFIDGLREVAGGYDAFLVDLWGTVHDGIRPGPGALDCLYRLKAGGRRVLFLSNAPRPAAAVAERLRDLGVPDDCWDAIVSSGDATIRALNGREDPWHAALGRRYFHLGPAAGAALTDEIEGEAAGLEHCDYLLATGLVDDRGEDPEDYRGLFERALARGLPLVSANPDLVVMRGETTHFCAGALARLYAGMGGQVRQHGKPDAGVFDLAFRALGQPDKARVLMIGDGLATDIAGARGYGLDSLWIASGIHGAELGVRAGAPLDRAAVAARLEAHGARPSMVLERLSW